MTAPRRTASAACSSHCGGSPSVGQPGGRSARTAGGRRSSTRRQGRVPDVVLVTALAAALVRPPLHRRDDGPGEVLRPRVGDGVPRSGAERPPGRGRRRRVRNSGRRTRRRRSAGGRRRSGYVLPPTLRVVAAGPFRVLPPPAIDPAGRRSTATAPAPSRRRPAGSVAANRHAAVQPSGEHVAAVLGRVRRGDQLCRGPTEPLRPVRGRDGRPPPAPAVRPAGRGPPAVSIRAANAPQSMPPSPSICLPVAGGRVTISFAPIGRRRSSSASAAARIRAAARRTPGVSVAVAPRPPAPPCCDRRGRLRGTTRRPPTAPSSNVSSSDGPAEGGFALPDSGQRRPGGGGVGGPPPLQGECRAPKWSATNRAAKSVRRGPGRRPRRRVGGVSSVTHAQVRD